MKNRKIYFFIGTTAELIRIAPIIREFKKRQIKFKIITSGQVEVLFKDLSGFVPITKADIAFRQKVNRSSLFHFAIWAIRTFFVSLIKLRKEFSGLNKDNSYFIICGDPVTTSIGAIVAYLYGLKIVHIESGDMSSNLLEPFPEEICRNINVRLADILFPPGKWAENNLKSINKTKINTYHNTMVEGFWWFMKNKVKGRKELKGKKYYLLILHRQEHVLFGKNWSKTTLELVIKNANPSLACVLFNHPLTKEIIESLRFSPKIKKKNLVLMPPVSYPEFLKLMRDSEFIATDGATNQLEAYLMGKPCLILRDHTEQVEGLGENVVLYKSNKNALKNFLSNYKRFRTRPFVHKIKPSAIIVKSLMELA